MHFTCEKQAIKFALDQAKQVVSPSSNMPILGHVCLTVVGDTLEIVATDLNISIIAKVEVKGLEDGSVAVLGDSITKIVEGMELGEIEFELNARSSLIINTKNSHYELPTLPSSEFPAHSVPKTNCFFNIDGKNLSYMLSTVKFAAADASSTRVNMQSVLFDVVGGELVLVSTDGKRMAKVSCPLEDEGVDDVKVIVPSKAVEKLCGLLKSGENFRVDICDKQIFFSNASFMFSCTFIDASYPDYTRFFVKAQESVKRCTVDRLFLYNALRRVNLMAQEKTNKDLVQFRFESDVLTLTSSSSTVGSGKESVAVYYDGEPMEICFNSVFITQVLNALVCDQVEMDIKGVNAGIIIRPLESTNYDYICMPMRGH